MSDILIYLRILKGIVTGSEAYKLYRMLNWIEDSGGGEGLEPYPALLRGGLLVALCLGITSGGFREHIGDPGSNLG